MTITMISTQFCSACGAANEPGQTHCFACGQLLDAGTDGREAQDEVLLHDRYQLGTTLGSGGFSAVYRAHDLQSGREVAIKQIRLAGLNVQETIEATDTFNRELSLLAVLRHPQVPRLYDQFRDREHWYLVLEYLEGTTLETYLEMRTAQGQPLQVDEAIAIGLQLCRVLEYLHTRQPPVIFRDLKPGNIMRSPGGRLSLIDFGIARHFRPGQARDTRALGSPGYAAPEQYGRAQTTPQSDLYSLGALLHALLSGQDPSEQPVGLAPLRLGSSAPENELAALAQRMLAFDPGERPATVHEVAATLEAIRRERVSQDGARIWQPPTPQDLPSSMGGQRLYLQLPAQPGNIPRRGTSRRIVLIGLGALATAMIGEGILWLNTSRSLISYPGPSSFGPTDIIYSGHAQPVTAVAWSRDDRWIASGSYDETVQVWDATSGRNVLKTYHGHSAPVNAVAWSPDGKRIASGSNDHTVQVWDAANGGHVFTYRGHSGAVTAVAWSPDGGHIASGSYDDTVQVWNATTGENAFTYQGHTEPVVAVAWSHDDGRIASASWDDTVRVWNAL
jgi:eukaryotic-like serine/threonine-protein kinase